MDRDERDFILSSSNDAIDPVDLVSEHYEAIDMHDDFRRDLLAGTRAIVAARRKHPLPRWSLGLAAVAAIVLFLLAGQFIISRDSIPLTTSGANRAQTPRTPGAPDHDSLIERTVGSTSRNVMAKGLGGTEPRNLHGVRRPDSLARTTNSARISHPAPNAHRAPHSSGPPIVALISVQPPVTDASGKALEAGDRLPAGATIRTGRGGGATLVTHKGSELHLDSNTELVFGELSAAEFPKHVAERRGVPGTTTVTVSITRGRLYCANRDKEIARIDTPAGRVRLLGTVVDTAVVRKDTVAVTVVEGKVELTNAHGDAVVDAGKRSTMVAYRPPQSGVQVDTYAETSWYHGRGQVQSDFGDIAFQVRRGGYLISEVWTMKADGRSKHRVRSFIGYCGDAGGWLPGSRWLNISLNSLLWTTPSVGSRIADAQAGHPITAERSLLLDAVTGQTAPMGIPEGYQPLYCELAPAPSLMAFCGWHKDVSSIGGGVWLLNRRTGKLTQLLKGDIKTAPAWSPDSRHIAISTGEGYTVDHKLAAVDVAGGQVRDLGINGAGACYSPDGRKLAYCAEFKARNAWWRGVPDSGNIFVLDLTPGAKPIRVSPVEAFAVEPRWSPDGSRLLYRTRSGSVWVVRADGTEALEVFRESDSERLLNTSWAPSGKDIYLTFMPSRSRDSHTLLVAADGSGSTRVVDEGRGDAKLSAAVQKQTDAACAAIREAVFQFAMGNVRSFEGNVPARRQCFAAAADIFSRLVWDYPLSGLCPDDALHYADAAAREAEKPDADVLRDSCAERMRYLHLPMVSVTVRQHQFPPDLPTALDWTLGTGWRVNWLSSHDAEHVRMLDMCPGIPGGEPVSYAYHLPPLGQDPKAGDVMVSCPLHPENCVEWEDDDIECLHARLNADGEPGAWCLLRRGVPYRFENVGQEPMAIICHALADAYEIRGTAKLLPIGKVYSNETVQLGPMDEGSVARAIDAVGVLDWGNLPKDELARAQDELEFCRAVAEAEAGVPVTHYFSIDGEPAKPIYAGQSGGSCGGPGLQFDLIGPGHIEIHRLSPSGRFHVKGTVRVAGHICKNGWIDESGRVTSTER